MLGSWEQWSLTIANRPHDAFDNVGNRNHLVHVSQKESNGKVRRYRRQAKGRSQKEEEGKDGQV